MSKRKQTIKHILMNDKDFKDLDANEINKALGIIEEIPSNEYELKQSITKTPLDTQEESLEEQECIMEIITL